MDRIEMEALLANTQENLDAAFITAVRNDSLPDVKKLLAMGANINARDSAEFTGLMYAALMDNLEMTEFLADSGSDLHATNSGGNTALHLAAIQKNPETAQALLDRGADINARDFTGQTAVFYAIGYPPALKVFLDADADINLPNYAGMTPLIRAAREGFDKSCPLLLEKNPDLEAKDENGSTALAHAAMSRDQNMIRLLAEAGAKLYPVNSLGKTPSEMTPSAELKTFMANLRDELEKKELSVFKDGLPYPVKATKPPKFKRGP